MPKKVWISMDEFEWHDDMHATSGYTEYIRADLIEVVQSKERYYSKDGASLEGEQSGV